MANDTKEAALKYAAIGIAVFPVIPPIGNEKSAGKKPYISNWQNEATTSREKITEWWTKWPDANIGIVTGRKSDGLVVIDLDIDDNKGINGYEVLKEWQREHGNLPETWQSITGRGGYHLFYYDSVPHKSRVVEGEWTLEELHDMANYGIGKENAVSRILYLSLEARDYFEKIKNDPGEAKRLREELAKRMRTRR